MKPLRSDAALRRDHILEAARDVFSEHGVNAPLDLVVERAGVGRATLYRNFENRSALLEALLDRSLQVLEDEARRQAGREDALFLLLERLALNIVESAATVDYWRAMNPDDSVIAAARQRVTELFRDPLRRAIDAGLCRSDLQLSDIHLIAGTLGTGLRGTTPSERREQSRRTLDLLLWGLRSRASSK